MLFSNSMLSLCFWLTMFLAMIGTSLNSLVPEVNYKGLWGVPHFIFVIIVTIVFFIGAKWDQRMPPKIDTSNKFSLRSLRLMTCFGQASLVIALNILISTENKGSLVILTKVFTTIAVILRSQILLSELIDREFEDNPPKNLQMALYAYVIFYGIISISYALKITLFPDELYFDFIKYVEYFFAYIQWVFIASIISGIFRSVPQTQCQCDPVPEQAPAPEQAPEPAPEPAPAPASDPAPSPEKEEEPNKFVVVDCSGVSPKFTTVECA